MKHLLTLALALILATGPNVFGGDRGCVFAPFDSVVVCNKLYIFDGTDYNLALDPVPSTWVDTVPETWVFPDRPALTIFYVDTVGWEEGWVLYSHSLVTFGDGRTVPLYYRGDVPILDTVIVGAVRVDSIPDKQLHIRKDQ